MARTTELETRDGDRITTDTPAGTEIEITYNGSRGSRTVTAYVTQAFDPYPNTDQLSSLRVYAAEPDARHARFLNFSVSENGPRCLEAIQNLGLIEEVALTGEVNETYAAFGDFYASREGDVVRLNGDTYTVINADQKQNRTLADVDGNREKVSARPTGLSYTYTNEREDTAIDEYERTGERNINADADMVFAAIEGYGHDHDQGKVEAVEIDGARYEVVFRNDAEENGIRLSDGDVARDHRDYNTILKADPLGLRLTTALWGETERQRISVEDVTLLREQ